MKVALTADKGVAILTVADAITEHDIDVLRAGLVKIFKAGKNKIVLELTQHDSLPSEVIRELASFDVMARELAGRLVIAGVSPALKTKIEVFAKPPVILIFEGRDKAIEFFTTPPAPEAEPAAIQGAAVPNFQALEAAAAAATALRQEQDTLQSRLAELTQENARLKEQLVLTTLARRPPVDEATYLEKIQSLEARIEKFLTEPPAAPAAPATPAK